jgi:4'-phosphopantetheinyl transferase
VEIYWLEQTEPDVPADDHWLSPEESICLHSMRFAKRRNDWRLGRWTAKRALVAHLRLPTDIRALVDVEIHAAESGAPEVFLYGEPADVAISLSHRAGTALCTVGPPLSNFGCDLERIEPRSEAFVADYFTAAEQGLIERTNLPDRSLLLALLWSAKESALKALRVGLRLDTRSISVVLSDDWSQGTSPPEEWRPFQLQHPPAGSFEGWWRAQHDLVRTVVGDPPLSSPLHAIQGHPLALTATSYFWKEKGRRCFSSGRSTLS